MKSQLKPLFYLFLILSIFQLIVIYFTIKTLYDPSDSLEVTPSYLILLFILMEIALLIKLYRSSKQIHLLENRFIIKNLFNIWEFEYSEIHKIERNHQFARGGIDSDIFKIITKNKIFKFEKAIITNFEIILSDLEKNLMRL